MKFIIMTKKRQTVLTLTVKPRLADILMIYRVSGRILPESISSCRNCSGFFK